MLIGMRGLDAEQTEQLAVGVPVRGRMHWSGCLVLSRKLASLLDNAAW